MDERGEHTRLVCRYGRRARNIVGQISLTDFRRDAENGNWDGCSPHCHLRLGIEMGRAETRTAS